MKETTINDYVKAVHEKFPELTEYEVKRILTYGWKMIIQYVCSGNDIMINTTKEFVFFGYIHRDMLKTFQIYCTKLARRIRYMFKKTYSQWDGHYYFARTEKQYQDYLSQHRKKIKTFKDVFLYKLLEEVKIDNHNSQYIFRLSEDKMSRMKKYYPELKTKEAELIIVRDPLKMGDILTSQNKFKYINSNGIGSKSV